MELHLIRHGPKNNDPAVHGTGVEALLDPEKIPEIRAYASRLLRDNPKSRFYIETTPVERAIATGTIIGEELSRAHPRRFVERTIDDMIGSYASHPVTKKAVNLSPGAMSTIWAESKKAEKYKDLQGEHKPLYAWCEQGFDNPQANNPKDPGISLREVACRIGTYMHHRLPKMYAGDVVIAIGHSGDIEPFLYLTLEMLEGKKGEEKDTMEKRFSQTDGALEPLTGLVITPKNFSDKKYSLSFKEDYECDSERCIHQCDREISLDIFAQQARWYREEGKSYQVLEQKIFLEK